MRQKCSVSGKGEFGCGNAPTWLADDGRYYCGLHDPKNVEKRAALKAQDAEMQRIEAYLIAELRHCVRAALARTWAEQLDRYEVLLAAGKDAAAIRVALAAGNERE